MRQVMEVSGELAGQSGRVGVEQVQWGRGEGSETGGRGGSQVRTGGARPSLQERLSEAVGSHQLEVAKGGAHGRGGWQTQGEQGSPAVDGAERGLTAQQLSGGETQNFMSVSPPSSVHWMLTFSVLVSS